MKLLVIAIFIIFACVIFVSGCTSSFTTNYRNFEKKNLRAQGYVHRNFVEYFSIRIGDYYSPFADDFNFYIMTSDGEVINSSDFSYDKIKGIADRVYDSKSEYISLNEKKEISNFRLEAEVLSFSFQGYWFVFVGRELTEFSTNYFHRSKDEETVRSISKDGVVFHDLPIREEDFISIFGKPDNFYDRRLK